MRKVLLPLLAAVALAAPAAANEVEVTRFHTAASLGQAAPGPIAVRPAAGLAAGTLEAQLWLDAVAAALTRQGFTVVTDAPRVAEVGLEQALVEGGRRGGSAVSVGVGVGSGGGWYGRRSGVDLGVGLGVRLGGGRRAGEMLATRLAVTIRDAAGAPAWEGRAEASPRARSSEAHPRTLADDMASALFSGFPGESGATIGGR